LATIKSTVQRQLKVPFMASKFVASNLLELGGLDGYGFSSADTDEAQDGEEMVVVGGGGEVGDVRADGAVVSPLGEAHE
jgi:hypothetical protein